MNADVYADTAQGVVGTNMFAYCNNNPIRLIDPTGTTSGVSAMEENLNGEAISIFGIIVFIIAYFEPIIKILESLQRIPISSAKTETITLDKTLADTKVKYPNRLERVYQYAYINQNGELIRGSKYYTFVEIIAAIGVLEKVSSNIFARHTYSGNSEIREWAASELPDAQKRYIGEFTQINRLM